MEYGCFLFPYHNYSLMKKLDLIQFRAIRLYLGLRNSTPTNVILAEAGEGPLETRFFFLTSRFLLKTFSQHTHPVLDKLYFLRYHARISSKINPSFTFLLFKVFENLSRYKSRIAPFVSFTDYINDFEVFIFEPSVIYTPPHESEIIKNSPIPQIVFQNLYSSFFTHTSFFTDASKKDFSDYTGFAIYSPSLNLQLTYRTSFTSVYSGEASAILYAIQYILSHSIPNSVIYTDSRSVVESISSTNIAYSSNHIILTIKQMLYDIEKKGLTNTIVWIPSHSGILGNKTADLLANRAISQGETIKDRLPYSNFYEMAWKWYTQKSYKLLSL